MYALISQTTDGCTYTNNETLCIFKSQAVADLVAEAFNAEPDPSAHYYVEPIVVYEQDSEEAVASIVDDLRKAHGL